MAICDIGADLMDAVTLREVPPAESDAGLVAGVLRDTIVCEDECATAVAAESAGGHL